MMRKNSLETRTRASAGAPLLVVIHRSRAADSDACVRMLDEVALAEQLEAFALDVDAQENKAFLDELRVEVVPEVLVFAHGVVLDRAPGVADTADARAWLRSTLRRTA